MIEVRLLNRSQEYAMLASWYAGRGMPAPGAEYFPEETSYLALFDGKPVCAKVLLLTNVPYAMTESAIADPESDPLVRKACIMALNEVLIREAKLLGYTLLVMYSNMPRTWEKAIESGFIECGTEHKLLIRRL